MEGCVCVSGGGVCGGGCMDVSVCGGGGVWM